MTQFPPVPPVPSQHPTSAPQASSGGSGLAIAALVLAIVGLCFPLLGIVAVVLGVVVLARKQSSGRGMAIASIVVGCLSVIVSFGLMLGLLLPALNKARATTLRVKSSVNMMQVAKAMSLEDFTGATGEAGSFNLEMTLDGTPPSVFRVTNDIPAGVGTSYLLLVPTDPKRLSGGEADLVVLVENPKVFDRRDLSVAYADGHVEQVPRNTVEKLIADAAGRVYNTDGTPWKR